MTSRERLIAADLLTAPDTHPESYVAEIAEADHDAGPMTPSAARRRAHSHARRPLMHKDSIRIWRSPDSDFYNDETLHAAEVYTPGCLHKIADAGFNAIWIRAILRDIAPTRVFPEQGRDSAAHLRSLRTVIRRADRAGVKVFLYMQEPMGMAPDAPFWKQHPDTRGVTYPETFAGPMSTLCTSHPKVTAFLRAGAHVVSRRLPHLAGVILITASEYPSHCYSYYPVNPEIASLPESPRGPLGCPRCRRRHPREVVREIIGSIHAGFQDAGHGAEVVAWNWAWNAYEKDPQAEIVRRLPRSVTLLSDFERGDTKVILGKPRDIEEYALSFAGPSRRFRGSCRTARSCGMRVMAKLQIGTTHELATVPNLPLIGRLYDKARAMRRLQVRDFMGCWNFGNLLTANTAAFNDFLTVRRLPPRRQALAAFACRYFPGCDAQGAAEAWEVFGKAMDSYPFCVPFLYESPLNYAVAQAIEPGPLDTRPVGPSWLPAERGDQLKESFGCYTLNEIIQGLGIVARTWWKGVERLEAALAACEAPTAQEEIHSARMAGHCFQSGWNLYRAYRLRRNWSARHQPALRAIMRNERHHLPDAAAIAQADKRMGFHIEPQLQMFSAAAIRKKLKTLDAHLQIPPAQTS